MFLVALLLMLFASPVLAQVSTIDAYGNETIHDGFRRIHIPADVYAVPYVPYHPYGHGPYGHHGYRSRYSTPTAPQYISGGNLYGGGGARLYGGGAYYSGGYGAGSGGASNFELELQADQNAYDLRRLRRELEFQKRLR